jgi:hypothetical protein
MLGESARFLVDTGTTLNAIDQATFENLNFKQVKIKLCTTNVYGYGSTQALQMLGTFETCVRYKSHEIVTRFAIIKGYSGCILGLETLKSLNIISISCNLNIERDKYPNLFSGKVGKFKDTQVKLHIKPDIRPICQPHRRIPFHLRQKVEDEIQRMLEMDIIEPAKGPTPWVSPIVIVQKPGQPDKIRICTDARLPNQAIERVRHVTPTVEDIIVDINGAKHISKTDFVSGYHQFELAPESRYITVFSTHIGLFQYKRLNFGINCAAEIFQRKVEEVIRDIKNIKNIKTPTDKLVIDAPEIKFFGMIFLGNGVRPDVSKIKAIKRARPPKNASELRSFLGLAAYVSRFIEDYATISEPLWRLT